MFIKAQQNQKLGRSFLNFLQHLGPVNNNFEKKNIKDPRTHLLDFNPFASAFRTSLFFCQPSNKRKSVLDWSVFSIIKNQNQMTYKSCTPSLRIPTLENNTFGVHMHVRLLETHWPQRFRTSVRFCRVFHFEQTSLKQSTLLVVN